jgi:hypothetical protein
MIRKIQRHWFEVWGQEEAQNRFLKYLLLVTASLIGVLLTTVCILSLKKTPVVFVDPETSAIFFPTEPDSKTLEHELIRILKQYLMRRHNWDWTTIETKAKEAGSYVAPEFREKYLLATQEQITLAKEKQVTQKLFPEEPVINQKEKKAVVQAERILIVSGIRASQQMIFELGFSFGERTQINPEGVYITSEKLNPPVGN